MYRGTYDGDLEEIQFVTFFNSHKAQFANYLRRFAPMTHLWLVRVTTKQFSALSGKKVFTRSDCYLAHIPSSIDSLLAQTNYYLSEEILNTNAISYTKIPFSGISVKMTTSKSFQILKVTPDSFQALFGCFELGAGASLFCKREDELPKNPDLIAGWKTSIPAMTAYFSPYTKGENAFYLNSSLCKAIKKASCDKITQRIEQSIDLQQKIFNGIGLYDEPYTAFYFYHGSEIVELHTIPFLVTTGSGRSKGDYTIVLKPKNK